MKGHLIALTTVLILAVLATSAAQTQQNAIAHPGQPGKTHWFPAGRYYWDLHHIQSHIHPR